jgi:hypothetical protein
MSNTKLKPDSISAIASSTVFFGYPDYGKLIGAFLPKFFKSRHNNSSVELKRLEKAPNVLEAMSMSPKLLHPTTSGGEDS